MYIIGTATRPDLEMCWLRDDDGLLFVWRQNTHFGEMRASAAPVIDDGKFHHRDGQLLDDDVLKDAHQRKLWANLQPHIITKKRIDQFQIFCLSGCYHFFSIEIRGWMSEVSKSGKAFY